MRACWIVVLCTSAVGGNELKLKDGDRIVLLGSTLIEREQQQGHWEALLHASAPGKKIVVRNLGWSGDTVFGEARAGFGTVEQGFQRLVSQVKSVKPTIILIAYGTNESFVGEDGVEKFIKGYNRLLVQLAPTKARIILLSPLRQENLGSPFPDPTARNRVLALYVKAIKALAANQRLPFVDLFHGVVGKEKPSKPLTSNGIHLTSEGYARTAPLLHHRLGLAAIARGIDQEKLREAIVEKNRLYFHRWRPQNVTYLFGFRKHEQGRNAKEVAQLDPIIVEKDKAVSALTGRQDR